MSNPFAHLSRFGMVSERVSLAPYTTWRIGGPARYLWEPNEDGIRDMFAICQQENIPLYYLGLGSNVLIDDAGLPGLVIALRKGLKGLRVDGERIIAGAGEPMPNIARAAAAAGLDGFSFMVGIPGTLGGGITMNAGLSARVLQEMKDVVESVTILTPAGEKRILTSTDDFRFAYRTSAFQHQPNLILQATLRASGHAEPALLKEKMRAHLAERAAKQPLDKATAGSVFKSVTRGQPAGFYIEQAGLKGLQLGGAMVSPKHANWIENTGTATSRDVLELIEVIRARVNEHSGVWLEPEIHLLSGRPDATSSSTPAGDPALD